MSNPLIAIAGFQHETNSFSSVLAGMPEFEMADSWPGLERGTQMLAATSGLNLPIAGFAAAAETAGARVAPLLWCAAEPSGPVTAEAFETILGEILDGIAAANPNAVYLDLHGAMIAEGVPDGESEILRRVRARFGNIPLAISLDMHANVGTETVELADVICIYRTYPHLDMAATGARCVPRLLQVLDGKRFAKAFRSIPYLIPMHAQATEMEPALGIYAGLRDDDTGWSEFAVGFTAGDTPVCAPSVLAFADSQAAAAAEVETLTTGILAAETAFAHPLPSANTAVLQAMAMPTGKPVVIADVQDNPGGGGSSDTTGLLRALVGNGARGALLGVMADAEAARDAHRHGIGAIFETGLGGRGTPGDVPFEASFEVMALSDGRVAYEGAMYGGGIGEIGPTALLRVNSPDCDVEIVVSSTRNQCLDRAYFRHIGRPPEDAHILGVKSTAHFRADFAPIAQAILPCAAPGDLSCDLKTVPYQNLRPGIRLGPGGPAFESKTQET